MAFPGTYNFSYYRGDTYEFSVIPKDSAGAVLANLDGYTPEFKISSSRGPDGASETVTAVSTISADKIDCVITPSDSASLPLNNTYVYDVQITDDAGSYPKIYTVLTGTITVTEQVGADS